MDSVEAAKLRLVKQGCQILKDEPEFPRCYIRDPDGNAITFIGNFRVIY